MEKTVSGGALARSAMLCAAVLAALGAGCAGRAAPADSAAPTALGDFNVVSRGQDAGGDFCRDFQLTPARADWFFKRARIVSAARQHDDFNHLPCWVRGTARGAGGAWSWEVRAGGTARLVGPDGTAWLLGCADCDAVLRGDEAPPP